MMEVQEICRKLKPILGAKAERYWLAYLAEDYIGKRELEIVLNLLAAKHLAGDLEEKHDSLAQVVRMRDDLDQFLEPCRAVRAFRRYQRIERKRRHVTSDGIDQDFVIPDSE